MKYSTFILAFFTLSISTAQDRVVRDTTNIPEVVVRATLVEDSLQRIPASIALLRKAELSSNNGAIITAAMNTLPGVFMQQGALNTNRITIRGIGARTQYGTDRLKAYIDGIPITGAAGNTVIEDIDSDILESIEVVKGPGSSLFGAGLGGTISLYTPELNQNSAYIASTLGSFGYLKNSVVFTAGGEKSGVLVNYAQVNSDGYRDNSNYSRKSLSVAGKLYLSETTRMKLFSNIVRLNAQIPSSLNYTDFTQNPTAADANWAAAEGYESYDRVLAGVTVEHDFSSSFRNATTLFGHYRDAYEPRPFDILDDDQLGMGARTKFNLKYLLFGKQAELVFGAEFLTENYSIALYENLYRDFPGNGSIQGNEFSNSKQRRSYLNTFITQQWSVSGRFLLDLGFNLNATKYDLDDTFSADSLDQSGSYSYGLIPSPRLAASYAFSETKNLYASVSQGFSTPGVEETLTPSGQINMDLLPETGWNIEIGMKSSWFDNKLYFETAVFTIFVENLLVAERVAEDQYIGINAGKTQHTGLEILLQYDALIGKNWLLKPYVNTSLNHFRFKDFKNEDQNYSGNDLTGVPGHTLNFGLSTESVSGFHFRINLLNVGAIPLNDANSEFSSQYNLLNLNAGYAFKMYKSLRIKIYAGVNNLTDENYAASILPNAVGFGGAQPRYYYPGDARNFYAGVVVGIGN